MYVKLRQNLRFAQPAEKISKFHHDDSWTLRRFTWTSRENIVSIKNSHSWGFFLTYTYTSFGQLSNASRVHYFFRRNALLVKRSDATWHLDYDATLRAHCRWIFVATLYSVTVCSLSQNGQPSRVSLPWLQLSR